MKYVIHNLIRKLIEDYNVMRRVYIFNCCEYVGFLYNLFNYMRECDIIIIYI